ncbi:MAG: hypothetical protein ACO3RV_00835 [Luteolibacter sp.]
MLKLPRLLATAMLLTLPLRGAADHVIVTGGPALRQWEDLRVESDRHDRWWGNYVRASTLRMAELRKTNGKNALLVWLAYRPGYRSRGAEDGKPYVEWITDLARKRRAELVWFDDSAGFIRAMNARPARSIVSFDYFGHSNKHAFMFDYGNDIMAASVAWFHELEMNKLDPAIFHKDAHCQSWGCHTGESMSRIWLRHLKVPLIGARGPTNYTMVGRGEMPRVNGSWVQ